MATRKTGIIVGIVAVAVIGIVAIFYTQRQPAERDATGAIGAAERYRAEQITDEDVILDIPGQEELAAAVFDVMVDEQKAELLGRMGEAGRAEMSARFEDAEALARMNFEQMGRFAQSLDRASQERVANALRIEAEDIGRMNADVLGRALARMDAEARAVAIGRFEADEALARMNDEQLGRFAQSLDRASQERVANALRIEAQDIGRLNAEVLGRALAQIDAEARAAAIGRFDADMALARMNDEQLGRFAQSLDRAAQERVANSLRFEAEDIGRMQANMVGRALSRMDAEARAAAVGRFDADEALARMNEMQLGSFAQSLDRAAQSRVANSLRFEADDVGRLNAEVLGRALARMDTEARAATVGRFEATDEYFQRMDLAQRAAFADALGAKAFERAILQARAWNGLSRAQQWAAWTNLGRQGQEAALRYAGVPSADLERSDTFGRTMTFARFAEQGRAAEHGAAARD